MSRPSWCEFTTAIWCVMRKRASPCWLQLCLVGSYHPRPLRDAHSSRRNLRVRRASRQAKPLIGANKHTSQHRNGVSAAAGAPGTDAAADAQAAVGVNCSSSLSSSELSACWLGCIPRRNCNVSHAPLCYVEESTRMHLKSWGIVWGNWSNSVFDNIDTQT